MAQLPMQYQDKMPIKVITNTYSNITVPSSGQYKLSDSVYISGYTAIGVVLSNFSGTPKPVAPVLLNGAQLWILSETQTITQLKLNIIYVDNNYVNVLTS